MQKEKIHIHICDVWGFNYVPYEIRPLVEENSNLFDFEFSFSGSYQIFEFIENPENPKVDIFIISGNFYTTRIDFEEMKELQKQISKHHPQAYVVVSSSNGQWLKPPLVTGIIYTTGRETDTIKPVWDIIIAEISSAHRTTNGFTKWKTSSQKELHRKVDILEYRSGVEGLRILFFAGLLLTLVILGLYYYFNH